MIFSRPSEWRYLEVTCHECGHTWQSSCVYTAAEIFARVYWGALKIYGPLYLLTDLLRRRPVEAVFMRTVPNILRSSLFLAVNGGSFLAFICLLRRLIGRWYLYSAFFPPAFLASLCAILCERKSRRGLLMGYVGTLAMEVLYSCLKHRGYISPLPYGEVMMFSFASAVLLQAFKSKEGLHDAIGGVLGFLFRPFLPSGLSQLVRTHPSSLKGQVKLTIIQVALVSAWSFAIGYLVQVLASLVGLGTRAITQPRRLKKALVGRYNFRFAGFLASFAGGFKALNALIWVLPVPRDVRLVLAGLVAGLSMGFINSSTLSLYAAAKALEVLYFKAVKRGWAKSYYYGDVILYALATAIIFHAAFFEGHNLRPAYWHFLGRVTGGRIFCLNWNALDYFGTHASTYHRQRVAHNALKDEPN